MAELIETLARAEWVRRGRLGRLWERQADGTLPPSTLADMADCYKATNNFLAALQAAGMVVVPVEPTDEMIAAAEAHDWHEDQGNANCVVHYRAMLSSSGGKGEKVGKDSLHTEKDESL